jgi:hypothetical protein
VLCCFDNNFVVQHLLLVRGSAAVVVQNTVVAVSQILKASH